MHYMSKTYNIQNKINDTCQEYCLYEFIRKPINYIKTHYMFDLKHPT